MRYLTDPDEAWPSVGSPREPQSRPDETRSEDEHPVRPALNPVAWLRNAVGGRGESGVGFDAESLIPALSSIRSSAEILRDTPDIGPAERRRFAEIVLVEEARLEVLVKRMSKLAR